MDVYNLEPDEIVIMHAEQVECGTLTVTLVLTNQNLIQISKEGKIFKKEMHTVKLPLLDLKEKQGKPNVLVGKSPDGEKRLELYFTGFEKYYVFPGLFQEKKWASAIEKAYKECWIEKKNNENPKKSIAEKILPIKKLSDSRAKGIKATESKCPKCGAVMNGVKGTEVQCEYCDTKYAIK